MQITCDNRIPPASGLGSSSSSQALGLMAADLIAGRELDAVDLLKQPGGDRGPRRQRRRRGPQRRTRPRRRHGDEYIWRSFEVPELHGRRGHAARHLLDQPGAGAPAAGRAALRRGVQHGARAAHHRGAAGRRPGHAARGHRRQAASALSAGAHGGRRGGHVGRLGDGRGRRLRIRVGAQPAGLRPRRRRGQRVGEAMLEEFRGLEMDASMRMVTTSNEAAGIVQGPARVG